MNSAKQCPVRNDHFLKDVSVDTVTAYATSSATTCLIPKFVEINHKNLKNSLFFFLFKYLLDDR